VPREPFPKRAPSALQDAAIGGVNDMQPDDVSTEGEKDQMGHEPPSVSDEDVAALKKRCEATKDNDKLTKDNDKLTKDNDKLTKDNDKLKPLIRLKETKDNVVLEFPNGQKTRTLTLSKHYNLHEFYGVNSIDFEKFVFLADYRAICSYKDGSIEALLEPVTRETSAWMELEFSYDLPKTLPLTAISPDSERPISLLIGFASNECTLLNDRSNYPFPTLSMKISGLSVSQHDVAVDYLERLSNSVFFDLDLRHRLALSLSRIYPSSGLVSSTNIQHGYTISFPKFEYAAAPISLVQYAHGATDMPLLQYLSYYQSIEYYFPMYSEIETQIMVRNMLKDSSFDALRDDDIARLIGLVKSNNSRVYGDEKNQLRNTIRHCLDEDSLRKFLTGNEEMKAFFSLKKDGLQVRQLPLNRADADLRDEVAQRIYDIRCRVVHTKLAGGEGIPGLLLPFSKEAAMLGYDIELIRFVSQRVLIAASSRLRPIHGNASTT